MAEIYSKLASVYQIQGNLNLAIDYYNKSLKIIKERLRSNLISVADIYNNLA